MQLARAYLLISFAALGCGDDSNQPEDPFPDVAGTYSMEGGFDGLSPQVASFVGILVLQQPSRDADDLNGTLSITAEVDGQVVSLVDEPLVTASVTTSGDLTFRQRRQRRRSDRPRWGRSSRGSPR